MLLRLGRAVSVMKAVVDPDAQRVLDLARRLEPRLRRAFYDAVASVDAQVDWAQMADLLAAHRVGEALGLVSADVLSRALGPMADAVTMAAVTAGGEAALAAGLDPHTAMLAGRFGVTHPATVEGLRRHEMDRIREMSSDVLASVRATVLSGIAQGRRPVDVARDIRSSVGLTQRQTQAVLNYRTYLETRDHQALERELRDRRSDAPVQRSIDTGVPLSRERVDSLVARYYDRYVKFRAVTISRTEATRAASWGTMMFWRQQVDQGRIDPAILRRRWYYVHDDRVRHAHMMIPVMNPRGVGMGQPFLSELGPIMYPGDPDAAASNVVNCRCVQVIKPDYSLPGSLP